MKEFLVEIRKYFELNGSANTAHQNLWYCIDYM